MSKLAAAGVGLLAGAGGAAVCAGTFAAVYHPHGGGQIGDWTAFIVIVVSFVLGVPIGAAAGVAWTYVKRPFWQLWLTLACAGFICGVVALALAR